MAILIPPRTPYSMASGITRRAAPLSSGIRTTESTKTPRKEEKQKKLTPSEIKARDKRYQKNVDELLKDYHPETAAEDMARDIAKREKQKSKAK